MMDHAIERRPPDRDADLEVAREELRAALDVWREAEARHGRAAAEGLVVRFQGGDMRVEAAAPAPAGPRGGRRRTLADLEALHAKVEHELKEERRAAGLAAPPRQPATLADRIRRQACTTREINRDRLRAGLLPLPEPAPAREEPTGPRLEGYAVTFPPSRSVDLGGWVEEIAPGAVERTFREKIDVRALANHQPADVLGRLTAGTLRLKADSRGLWFSVDLPDTAVARDLASLVRRRDVTGSSFAFTTLEDEWRREGGSIVRTVVDMRIRECSVVSFPAYLASTVTARGVGLRTSDAWIMLARAMQ